MLEAQSAIVVASLPVAQLNSIESNRIGSDRIESSLYSIQLALEVDC